MTIINKYDKIKEQSIENKGEMDMKIEALGLPTAKTNQLKKKGIETVEELIQYLPRKYFDFTEQLAFHEGDGLPGLYGGKVANVNPKGKALVIKLEDELSPATGFVTFFGQPYLKSQIKVGDTIYIGGKVESKFGKYFVSPISWSHNKESIQGVQPVYRKVAGMSDDYLRNAVRSALTFNSKDDYLELPLLRKFDILPYHRSIRGLHEPKNMEQLQESRQRNLFDELFLYNFHLLKKGNKKAEESLYPLESFDKTTQFMKNLPFSLTDGQRESLRGITRKMKDGELVDALVMGDVGCGKTMVALLLMVGQAENGYQSVLMAPTNVLAVQHYNEAKELLEPLGFQVAFLNGATKVRERKAIFKGLADGSIDVLIGTHACVGKDVVFSRLSLCVVDEEHRFGVRQREAIRDKVEAGLHMVSMSATPIPRSLATTLYGEHVGIHSIKTLPSGRKPVQITLHEKNDEPYLKILEAVKRGEQAYVVCPLIEDNESETMVDIKSVEKTHEDLSKRFKNENVVVDYISGNMKEDEINAHLKAFKEGHTHVLVSTTVIEVGVNVPNATVMVIENAERFGASQIWQLKGRVGRGTKASACYLVSPKPNPVSKEKLEMICRAQDGFEVAREDLRLRGAGSLLGDDQSGGNRYIQLMLAHEHLNTQIRDEIKAILQDEKRRKRYMMLLKKDDEILEA